MNRLSRGELRLMALALGTALAAAPALAFAQSDSSDGLAGLACFCYAAILIFYIGLVYWTYSDAKARGNPNAGLWALLVFFAGIVGILLYYLLGRSQTSDSGRAL